MSNSIGAQLREARDLRHLTLQQVSETTRVRIHYLQALENDDLSPIPSMAQARGFLRIYAEFLELDLDDLVPPAPIAAVPAAEAPAQTPAVPQASRPTLLSGLLDRIARRSNKAVEASVPAAVVAPEPTPQPAVEPAAQPVVVPAATEAVAEAKTARRAKKTAPPADANDVASPTDVKKNAGQ